MHTRPPSPGLDRNVLTDRHSSHDEASKTNEPIETAKRVIACVYW
jgi:hypothetical protein